MDWFWDHYLDRAVDARNPYAAPLQAREFGGLPPATVVTAGFDALRDDGVACVDRLESAGVPVEHHHYPDMPHHVVSSAFHDEDVGRAREAISAVADSLASALGS
jgi:acetyl esterase